MKYRDLINQSIENVYQAGIATKIMQHMGRIRNNSDLNQARRWVMELLQNARDVAWPDLTVKVKIELTENTLVFSHTGRPFRVKDILSIVNQVSSKVDDDSTVGQFGTGFVTTFQLSEQVELRGVLKEEGLPYKPFRITIDRRGFTKDEILEGIETAMGTLESVDDMEELSGYSMEDFNTTFTYVLDNENSRKIARIGMEDLQDTIFYVLLFSQKIGSVELKYSLNGVESTVCYMQGETKSLGGKIQIADFWRITNGSVREKFQNSFRKESGITLAANYSEDEGFLPLSEKCSRLFIDFPLVGAEKFCFPVVINDLSLQPNEPRSGISLVDNPNSKDALENKQVMGKAVASYREFLGEVLGLSLKGVQHMMEIPFFEANKEISEYWVKSHIYKAIYKYCVSLPIYQNENGLSPLNSANMYLLRSETPEMLEKLKSILAPVRNVDFCTDSVDWYRVFAAYEPDEDKIFSLEKLVNLMEDYLRANGKIDEKQISPVKWCENVFRVAMEDEQLARSIRAGELAVFPNQKLNQGKVWYLRRIHEIRLDPGIPEELKDVTEWLDDIRPQYNDVNLDYCKLRENLLHREFTVENLPELMTYEWTRLGNYIKEKSNQYFSIRDYRNYASFYNSIRKRVWLQMAACGPDKEMYDLIARSIGEVPKYVGYPKDLDEGIWRNSYHGLLKLCIDEIKCCNNVENLRWYRSEDCKDIYQWLQVFYRKWLNYQHTNEDYGLNIYVNQEGCFKQKTELSRDGIKEKELKQIAYRLRNLSDSCNFYQSLLHEAVEVEGLFLSECRDVTVAMEMNRVITQLLSQCNLSDADMEYQEACTDLLAWIQNHPEMARDFFPAYSDDEGQMKLLTPRAAVRMQQKAHKFEQMMALLHCGDEDCIERLKALLEQELSVKSNAEAGVYSLMDGDVLMDSELYGELFGAGCDGDTLRQVCREIGVAGERYVLETLKEYYLQKRLVVVSESADEIFLKNGEGEEERTVRLYYPDSAAYHQPGWDICIEDSAGEGAKEYIEVKTHTKKSYFSKRVKLSNEQMKKAISEGSHYHVLVAFYDYYGKRGQEIVSYEGFLKHIVSGRLKNEQEGYCFSV